MKTKPTQYGIKIWCLANTIIKYVQKLEIYLGASDAMEKMETIGTRTLLDLMSGFGGKGHVLTCDNFFISLSLFWELLKDDIYARGTIRTNQKGWLDALTINNSSRESGQLWYRMQANNRMTAVT